MNPLPVSFFVPLQFLTHLLWGSTFQVRQAAETSAPEKPNPCWFNWAKSWLLLLELWCPNMLAQNTICSELHGSTDSHIITEQPLICHLHKSPKSDLNPNCMPRARWIHWLACFLYLNTQKRQIGDQQAESQVVGWKMQLNLGLKLFI